MNCQDISRIANSGRFDELDEAQLRALEAHAMSCRSCAVEWGAHRRVVELPVPPMPPELRQQCQAMAILPPQARRARNTRRLILIGSFVAAAAAAWQIAVREPTAATAASELDATGVASSIAAPVPDVSVPAMPRGVADEQPKEPLPSEARAIADVAVDGHFILVSRRFERAADAQAIALAERCFDTVASELQGLGGLTVIVDASVPRESPSGELELSEREQKLARSHGAGYMLVVSTEMGCNFTVFNSSTGLYMLGLGGGGVDQPGERADALARSIARGIHAHLVVGRSTEAIESRERVLNTGLSDRDRTMALFRLLDGGRVGFRSAAETRTLLDEQVMGVALQLAAKGDAEVRTAIWSVLRQTDDRALVQPLLLAMKNDPDRSVRYQAVQAARRFLDVPGVRETLLEMAAKDPDSEPEIFCCVETVREAAQRAAVSDQDFLAWARRNLLDESLSSRSRLFTLMGFSSDGRFVGDIANIGDDAAGIVFDIGQRDPNPRVRAMAWDILHLGRADKAFMAREVVPVALEDLRNSPNEYVRAGAARILFDHKEAAGVPEALERAQADASILVRRSALGEGGGPVSAY